MKLYDRDYNDCAHDIKFSIMLQKFFEKMEYKVVAMARFSLVIPFEEQIYRMSALSKWKKRLAYNKSKPGD